VFFYAVTYNQSAHGYCSIALKKTLGSSKVVHECKYRKKGSDQRAFLPKNNTSKRYMAKIELSMRGLILILFQQGISA